MAAAPAIAENAGCSAWNPGIAAGIPAAYRPLETLFRPECAFTGATEIDELSGLTGLPPEELTLFRPLRLALHEIIVRVTADIAVPEGDEEEVFGHNFRRIANALHAACVEPQVAAIEACYAQLRDEVEACVNSILDATLFRPPPAPPRQSLLDRLRRRPPPPPPDAERHEQDVVAAYKAAGLASEVPLERAVYRSLYRVLGALAATRGSLGADRELLARLVCRHVCNFYGSQVIGRLIAPQLDAAIEANGYTRVRNRDKPVLISLKGASAAGKSSVRPMLKQIMREQGIEPDGYATISPDIWRRLLLDFQSLGPAIKYAGPLTSRELMVVDSKLDRYIRFKANRDQAIPHILVDRFRFDSFSSRQVARVLHNTYARFVHTMYMYFVVTPPEETVVRGWQRALERGRYKAVEDFLGHSVEAYTGMPKILFKWLGYGQPAYRYFFLDNRVPKGTFPKTIARGDQAEMTLYDPLAFINIERYQKIDVNAASPAEVYPPPARLAVAANAGFLAECLRRITVVNFTEPGSEIVYLRASGGVFSVLDAAALARAMRDGEMAEVLRTIAPALPASP